MKYVLFLAVLTTAITANAQTKNGAYTLDRCYAEKGELEPYKKLGLNLCSQESRKKA